MEEEEEEKEEQQSEVCVDAVVSALVVVLQLPYYWYLRAVQVKISIENETILVDHLR